MRSCFVLALVEGPTEEKFIKVVLAPAMQADNVYITPVIHKTKENPNGADFKGGGLSYEKVLREIKNLLGSNADLITTMFDYYALSSSFPGRKSSDSSTVLPQKRVQLLEQAFLTDVLSKVPRAQVGEKVRFCPFLMLHEFETFLFVDPAITARRLGNQNQAAELTKIVLQHDGHPEEIDSLFTTSPSRRIESIFPGYAKIGMGSIITSEIGLASLGTACPHFGNWVAALGNVKC